MATKKELMRCWLECKDKENVIFLFDDEGDPIAWCSRCLHVDVWSLRTFEGEISHVIETKESFKEQHANCQPRQYEAKQEVKQGDEEMSNCLRSKIKRYWVRDSDDDRAKHIKFTHSETDRLNGDCDRCMTTIRIYGLANGQPINQELFDEIYAIKHQFIAKHWDCVVKAVAEQEASVQPSLERFPSGSIRDSQEGRGRYDLIPASSYKRLAIRTELGAKRYGDNNWKKGQPIERYLNSLKRHITEYEIGDRSEDHLAAAAWNAFSAMWTEDEIKAGRLRMEGCE